MKRSRTNILDWSTAESNLYQPMKPAQPLKCISPSVPQVLQQPSVSGCTPTWNLQ